MWRRPQHHPELSGSGRWKDRHHDGKPDDGEPGEWSGELVRPSGPAGDPLLTSTTGFPPTRSDRPVRIEPRRYPSVTTRNEPEWTPTTESGIRASARISSVSSESGERKRQQQGFGPAAGGDSRPPGGNTGHVERERV
jgi:hypothetical protein